MVRRHRWIWLAATVGLTAAGIGLTMKAVVKVGDTTDQGTVLPSSAVVKPSGATAWFKAAVLDAVPVPGKGEVIVKTADAVALVRDSDGKILSTVPLSAGASMTGLAISPDGRTVAVSDAQSSVVLYDLNSTGLAKRSAVSLPTASVGGAPYPCGLIFLDRTRLAIAASRDNSVIIADSVSGKVQARVPVEPAPYQVHLVDHALYVTCWGTASSTGGTEPSSGTQVAVDNRGIASKASLVRIDLPTLKVDRTVRLPLQPTEMVDTRGSLYVACANGGAVVKLDIATMEVQATIKMAKFSGSSPNSLALAEGGRYLDVACGGLNAIARVDLGNDRVSGLEKTAWYPSVVRSTDAGLLIGTAKGIGSRGGTAGHRSVYDVTGTMSLVDRPRFAWHDSGPRDELPARKGSVPRPVPERSGEPSVFHHVIYVIKENRTYDQLFGDMTEGNGDPTLAMFGKDVTPNQHALARQFVLLDNYYCNGIVSADGHAWATEANATTYYERSRGGWTRSYPFGDDPLATSDSGYLWDNALDHGVSVRNFGEFDYATPIGSQSAMEILHSFQSGKPFEFKQNIGVRRLREVSDPTVPGWNLAIPDALRADRYIKRLHEMEASGTMAALTVLYLPQDHTAGGDAGFPSPRAEVADNDLAVGKVAEALSHSCFWPDTVMFVEEDDPQNGFDHVDGYRSLCLVISPYTRRHVTISSFFNQAAVIHTMERILGLPPMNQNDAGAATMDPCFQEKIDLTPFSAVPNRIPLDEVPRKRFAKQLDIDKPDDDDGEEFNRRISVLTN